MGTTNFSKIRGNLQDHVRVPDDGVSIEVFSWIKPKAVLLFSATFSFGIDVGVQGVWFTRGVPQELKVDLIMVQP
jgi:hypothetical protein